jgi:hypothetical protein
MSILMFAKSARRPFPRFLSIILSVSMICAMSNWPAQAQREGRDRDIREDASKIATDAAANAIRKNLIAKYSSFGDKSYGGGRDMDAEKYTRKLFIEINSGIISDSNGHRTLNVSDGDKIDTQKIYREPNSTLLTAEHAFDDSWSKLFSPTVVDLVPRNALQFKMVFGESPSRAQMAELRRIRRDDKSAEKLKTTKLDEAFSSDSYLILFVGHNDRGAIVDTSGTPQDIDKLSKRCAELLKFCVFLACNAKGYITESSGVAAAIRDLGAREALKIARELQVLARNIKSTIKPGVGDDPSLRPHVGRGFREANPLACDG